MFSLDSSDKVIDIIFHDNKVYVGQQQIWSVDKCIQQIKTLRYSGMRNIKDPAVEDAKLPSIAKVFYLYIFNEGIVPSESDIVNTYLNIHFTKDNDLYTLKNEYISTNSIITFNIEGLKARILRTYPSLIRDFHFYLLCQESNLFNRVTYSFYNDYFKGLDLKVIFGGKLYYVSLNTKTKRGSYYKQKKYSRHDYSNIKEIHLEIDLMNSKNRAGQFILYDKNHINELVEKIHILDSNI